MVLGAASRGHLDLIKLLHFTPSAVTFGCKDHAMSAAAANGHLAVVQFVQEHRPRCTVQYCSHQRTHAINEAAANGYLNIVRYLHENWRHPCSAVTNGHLEVVKYLHENRTEGCTTQAVDGAVATNHLEVVKFLHENRTEGCKVDTLFECDQKGLDRIIDFLCASRPMATSARDRAIARAQREGRVFMVAKLECSAASAKEMYAYR